MTSTEPGASDALTTHNKRVNHTRKEQAGARKPHSLPGGQGPANAAAPSNSHAERPVSTCVSFTRTCRANRPKHRAKGQRDQWQDLDGKKLIKQLLSLTACAARVCSTSDTCTSATVPLSAAGIVSTSCKRSPTFSRKHGSTLQNGSGTRSGGARRKADSARRRRRVDDHVCARWRNRAHTGPRMRPAQRDSSKQKLRKKMRTREFDRPAEQRRIARRRAADRIGDAELPGAVIALPRERCQRTCKHESGNARRR